MAVIAVDWSGRATGEGRFVWTGEAAQGRLLRLEAGRTRTEVGDHLVEHAMRDDALVVGLDFSFSLPAWFLDERGFTNVDDLWDAATHDGERWLRDCEPPFWGRRGHPRPPLPAHLRATEAELAAIGAIRPKSTFQVGGAGSVGTGSVRGFPVLARLRRDGFSIWPFDAPVTPPVVVEIYPRALTGAVVKSSMTARAAYLEAELPDLSGELRARAGSSEDAFDAAVSAIVMSRHVGDLLTLPAVDDRITRREGRVWLPVSSKTG